MSKLERPDTTLYFSAAGQGLPVLLTHGFAATARMWEGQVRTFSHEHQLITWDMRGHGRSVGSADNCSHSEEATVADMAALLDSLGHERAVMGGHSLGGYMSLAFARAYPERVRALVIVDSGPGYKSDAARNGWNEMAHGIADRIEEEGLATLSKMSREMDPDQHTSARALASAARGMLSQRDSAVIDSLQFIRVPTLLVVGEKDREYLKPTDYMARKIPGARKVVIGNAGHAANLHQPDAFNRTLQGFLAEVMADDA